MKQVERGGLVGWLEAPMLVLAFVGLVRLVAELVRGESLLFSVLGTIIWIIFILDFGAKLILAPDKAGYLKRHWLTAVSLLILASRLFRVFRACRPLNLARTARSSRLVRVISSLNRGMKAQGASLTRRGFG